MNEYLSSVNAPMLYWLVAAVLVVMPVAKAVLV